MSECPVCEGSGDCQNDFHTDFAGIDPAAWANLIVGNECPACGQDPGDPGNCSTCGGSGEVND